MLFVLSFLLIVMGVVSYFLQMNFKAPYGKFHSRKTIKHWKFSVSGILKRYLPAANPIWEKYAFKEIPSMQGWMLQESPNLIFALLSYKLFKSPDVSGVNRLVLLLFIFHYLHRVVVYPVSMYANSKQKTTYFICSLAFLFSTYNGFLQGLSAASSHYNQLWSFFGIFTWIRVLIGLVIFCIGFWVNVLSDRQMMAARNHQNTPESDKFISDSGKVYIIPRGGLFELVTNPNYLGEIIEWFGYFIVAFNWSSLAFLIWSALYLIQRAKQNHEWYLQTFKNYPSDRFIIIPFLL